MLIRKLALLSIVALIGACQKKPNQIAFNEQASGIIGGEIVPAGHAFKKSVVKIVDLSLTGEQRICSATLVAKNVLLTAAHCLYKARVSNGTNEDELRTMESLVAVFYVGGFETARPVRNGRTFELPTNTAGANDLALLQIESAPSGAEPVSLLSDLSELKVAKEAILAGFGKSLIDEKDSSSILRQGRMAIESVDYNKFEVSLRKIDERSQVTCIGDSGGPAFIESKGRFYLWGVLRRGDPLCGYQSVYTKAYLFDAWIRSAVQAWH